jgi:hypothetical protein
MPDDPVLFQLDVIHVGVAMRALQVRLPTGEMAYLAIPEDEARKIRSALEAALKEDPKVEAETRFERILRD